MNEIEIYQSSDKKIEIQVQFENETVWLTQAQIVDLFQTTKSNISEHSKHIFQEGELDREQTVRKFRTVRTEGKKKVSRILEHYNLDLILSIGYRVNSKRGTQFRQWATQRLKDHLIKGYTLNKKQLQHYGQNLQQLEQTIKLIQQGNSAERTGSEVKGLLEIITQYTQSFILLNRFDNQVFIEEKLNETITYEIDYNDSLRAIEELRKQLIKTKEASGLFGKQKDKNFQGILKSIVQTFDGEYLYKTIEDQAAHLLYFIIKNHPFTDGNKRIGAFLFIWFLEKNKHRLKKTGEVKINDNGLTALALLIAQSNPNDKELMIGLIVNLIVDR